MNDLNTRLSRHIAQMAPHQKEREAGKLLIEAAKRIAELEKLTVEARESMLGAGESHDAPVRFRQHGWLNHVSKFEYAPFI